MRITHAGTSPAVSPVRALLFSFCAVFLVACIAKEPDSPITVSRAQTSGGPVVFQNVSVFDSESLQLVPNRDVIVRGNSIEAVVPSGGQPLPEAAHVVDGEGTTLVPGLIDMHGHISITTGPSWEIATPNPENNLRAYAYAGVTTVFDPGDSPRAGGRGGTARSAHFYGGQDHHRPTRPPPGDGGAARTLVDQVVSEAAGGDRRRHA